MTRIGSLCSGYGGLELGLMDVVGGSVAWHVEYDKHPAAVLGARFPGVPNYGDITTTDWRDVEPVDWLTAGYPCQPFSAAGKRQGEADERHLWPSVADAIRVLRPGRVLLENVAGHLSLGFGQVLGDLATLRYDARWLCLRAADAGAPHGRARVFIVATDPTRDEGRECDGDGIPAEWSAPFGRSAADAGGEAVRLGAGLRQSGAPGLGWGRPDDDSAPTVPNTARHGRDEGWPEPAGLIGRPDAAECGSGVAADTECVGRDRRTPDARRSEVGRTTPAGRGQVTDATADAETGCGSDQSWRANPAGTLVSAGVGASGRTCAGDSSTRVRGLDGGAGVAWGAYAPAIVRWERVTGRDAPRPTEPGPRGGERLSPRFVEWMMGLPAGWVTDVGLPRNAQLKALGNGVVPQQAALAVRTLLSVEVAAA